MTEGPDRYEGNVQLLHQGEWSYVCDDDWDDADASVACNQLDSRGADTVHTDSYYGTTTGTLLINDMRCKGNESMLQQCPNSGWSDSDMCSINSKAGVSCTKDAIEDGTVRLMGTGKAYKGRVEIYHNGEWGTVCDDYWDYYDAKVVCRQLGYANAQAKAFFNSYFGQGEGRIWLDNVACYGSESRLEDCITSGGWGDNDCYHGEDAGVYCDLKGEFDAAEITGIVLGSLMAFGILVCCIKFIFCETAASKRHQRRRRHRNQRNRPTTTPTTTPEEHFEAHFNSAYAISGEQTEVFTPEGFLRPPPFPVGEPPELMPTDLPPTYEFVLANPISKGNEIPPTNGSSHYGNVALSSAEAASSSGASVAVLPVQPVVGDTASTVAGGSTITSALNSASSPEQSTLENTAMMPPVEFSNVSNLPYPARQDGSLMPFYSAPSTQPPQDYGPRGETSNETHECETVNSRDTSNVNDVQNPPPKENTYMDVTVGDDNEGLTEEVTVDIGDISNQELSLA